MQKLQTVDADTLLYEPIEKPNFIVEGLIPTGLILFCGAQKIGKSIPWGHNQRIMYKCKSIEEALFYVQKTMDNGWSRNVLEHQIDGGLYGRQGKAVTDFQLKLPEPQSDLAEQTLKNPYA